MEKVIQTGKEMTPVSMSRATAWRAMQKTTHGPVRHSQQGSADHSTLMSRGPGAMGG